MGHICGDRNTTAANPLTTPGAVRVRPVGKFLPVSALVCHRGSPGRRRPPRAFPIWMTTEYAMETFLEADGLLLPQFREATSWGNGRASGWRPELIVDHELRNVRRVGQQASQADRHGRRSR
jgi:hypothetical protein